MPLDYTDPRAGRSVSASAGCPRPARRDGHRGGRGGRSRAIRRPARRPTSRRCSARCCATATCCVVDARGTGRSTPIDCEPLQSLPAPSPRFAAAVAACGQQLNHTFPQAGGGYVHASDLFTHGQHGARSRPGDQRAAARRRSTSTATPTARTSRSRSSPATRSCLRSVVLDSAYEARDLDPWYRTTVTTARARSTRCAAARSAARPGRLGSDRPARRSGCGAIRSHGTVVGTDARVHPVTVGITALVNIVNDAGYDTDPYRQLDAAARAYLDHRRRDAAAAALRAGRRLRLQRLLGRRRLLLRRAVPRGRVHRLPAAVRHARRRPRSGGSQLRRVDRRAAAPTRSRRSRPASGCSVLPYTETYTGCLDLAGADASRRPAGARPACRWTRPDVPVLILNGAARLAHAGRRRCARRAARSAAPRTRTSRRTPCTWSRSTTRTPAGRRSCSRSSRPRQRNPTPRACATIPRDPGGAEVPAPCASGHARAGNAPLTVRRLASVAVARPVMRVIRYNYVDGRVDLRSARRPCALRRRRQRDTAGGPLYHRHAGERNGAAHERRRDGRPANHRTARRPHPPDGQLGRRAEGRRAHRRHDIAGARTLVVRSCDLFVRPSD